MTSVPRTDSGPPAPDDTFARALFEQSPLSTVVYDTTGRVVHLNAAFERLFGVGAADVPPGYSVLTDPQLEAQGVLPLVSRAFAGEAVTLPPVRYVTQPANGAPVNTWTQAQLYPIRDAHGAITGVVLVHVDLTTHQEAQEMLRASELRLRDALSERERAYAATQLLAEVGAALASSLDFESTLANVARLAVPALADYCIIDLVDFASGKIECVATAHADPARESLLAQIRRFPPQLGSKGIIVRTLRTGVPQVVSPLPEPLKEASTSGNAEHAAILRELAPEAVMCAPLVARGTTLGTMLLASSFSGRRYNEQDLALATEVARRAAVAVDNARLHRDVEAILAGISDPFVVYDRDWRFRYVNAAARAIFRRTNTAAGDDGLLGTVLWKAYPELRGSGFERDMRRAAESHAPITFEEYNPRVRQWAEVHCYPMPDGGLAAAWRDITVRKRAAQAEHFLSEATAILAGSLDYQTTLGAVAKLVVPRLADWCSVDLLTDDGTLDRVAVAHVDPDKVRWGHEVNRRYPVTLNDPNGVGQVVRTGEPEMVPVITDEMLAAGLSDAEYLELVRSLGLRSVIIVPLSAHGRTLGALSLVAAESGREYDDTDLQLAMEVGRRAALAVDNARLHQAALAAERQAAAYAAHAEQFRQAQEASLDPFALFDAVRDSEGRVIDFVWTWANAAALRVQGTSLDSLVGKRLLDRNPGVQQTPLFDGYRRAVDPGEPFETEVHYSHEWLDTWFRITAVPINGGIAVTFADISARKRAERWSVELFTLTQALSRANTRDAVGAVVLDRALPALGVVTGAFAELDPAGEELVLIADRGFTTSAMRAWQRYPLTAGTPGAEAIRTGDIVTIHTRAEWAARFPQHAEWSDAAGLEGTAVVPLRVGDRTIGIVTLHVPGPREFDPAERQFLLAFADQCAQALERVRLFEAEQRARQEISRVFAQAPVAIALTRGPEHVFQITNVRYEALVGRTNLIGVPVRDALPELNDQGIFQLMDRVLATGEPYVGMETPVALDRGPDGKRENGYFTFVFQPVSLTGDGVDGIAIVANDVTPQVRARLESDRLRSAAEEANIAKSEFLASMSHELRTPLNAIGGYADLLLLGVRGAITPEQRLDLERINGSQRHLLGVINDILNFARVEAGAVALELESVSVADVMNEVEPLVLPQLAARSLTFEWDAGPGNARMFADAEKVRQIVLNLLANAIKFTEAGGRVTMSAVEQGDEVGIRVHDTGIGIPPDRLTAVFEPFVQVHRTLARPYEGTGLGLTISRDLARAMGGDITVESTPGEGSTFTLTLPAAHDSEARARRTAAAPH